MGNSFHIYAFSKYVLNFSNQLTTLFNNTYYIHGVSFTSSLDVLYMNMELHDVNGEVLIAVFVVDTDNETVQLYKTSRGRDFIIQDLMMSYEQVFHIVYFYTMTLFEALLNAFEPYEIGDLVMYPFTCTKDCKLEPNKYLENTYDMRLGYDDLILHPKGICPKHLKPTIREES